MAGAAASGLNPNGALVVDLIPELKLVIGEQPPVPDVPPAAAKARVQITLRRLIGLFARAEHPLALFFDDPNGSTGRRSIW